MVGGFTLIELMIVVVIVAILATVAYPSYQESIRKTRRSDAQAALVGMAAVMEREFLRVNSYVDPGDAYPTRVPLESSARQTYSLAAYINSADEDPLPTAQEVIDGDEAPVRTYALKATRFVGGPQEEDKCGTLVLESTGQTRIENAESGVDLEDCWRR